MFSRRFDYLKLNSKLKKVEIEIAENKKVYLIDVSGEGYAIYSNHGEIDSNLYLIKTNISPVNFDLEENKKDKEQFIEIIGALLSKLYEGETLRDYEKKHPEHILMQLMDLLDSTIEYIDENDDLYKKLDIGFLKLELESLKENAISKKKRTNSSGDFEGKLKNILNTR